MFEVVAMWHPFKKNAHERKTRAENDFAERIDCAFADAIAMSDKAERLLKLEGIRQDIGAHFREVGIRDEHVARRKESDRLLGLPFGWFLGGILLNAVPVVAMTLAVHLWLAGILVCAGVGKVWGKRAQKNFLIKNKQEYAPFRERLEGLSARASSVIGDMLAAHMPEISRSGKAAEVLARVPQARNAFAAVAAQATGPELPPAPPVNPKTGLNL